MDDKQIRTEYKKFVLNEKQIAYIRALYNTTAGLLIETFGKDRSKDPTILKLTLNSLKFTVTQLLDLQDEERKNTFSGS